MDSEEIKPEPQASLAGAAGAIAPYLAFIIVGFGGYVIFSKYELPNYRFGAGLLLTAVGIIGLALIFRHDTKDM